MCTKIESGMGIFSRIEGTRLAHKPNFGHHESQE